MKFNDKDPMGLKKLDKDLSKVFGTKPQDQGPKLSKKQKRNQERNQERKPQPILTKQDKDNLIAVVKMIDKGSKYAVKKIRKAIKKTPDEIFEIEDKLNQEQVTKAEVELSKLNISKLKEQEKKFKRKEWELQKKKIRGFFKV